MARPNDETLSDMTPERWRQVRMVFEHAAEMDAGDARDRYVAKACEEDAAMMREVQSLLEADATGSDLLEWPDVATAVSVEECPRCGLCLEQAAGAKKLRVCPSDGTPLEKAFDGAAVIDGKFLVEMRLGRGGMGAVYRVRHLGLARRFALKLMLPMKGRAGLSRELFEREAKALGRLKHPHILDVTDFGVDPRGMPYLVTELLEGTTLHARCMKDGALAAMPLERTLELLEPIAEAIDFVHANGLLHRDLKLSNVFVADTVKLMDFGLASLAGMPSTRPAMGTPQYMAPEVVEGRAATTASDIYAFGVMAFVMLTGKMPGEAAGSGLAAEVDEALRAMLARDPATRPPSARTAVAQIRAADLAVRRREWRRREIPRRAAMAAVAAALAVLAAAALERTWPLEMLDLRAEDWRLAALPGKLPDPRIVLLLMDEASLNATPLAARSGEFGEVLERIFAAGARSVAVDFLLPETWSRSRPFADVVLRHAEHLTLGLFSDPAGETVGAECVAGAVGAALGRERLDGLFAFINLEQDIDGAIRQGRMFYPDRSGGARATWAAAAVLKDGVRVENVPRFRLDYAVRTADFARVSFKDAAERARRTPELFRGRMVLVGGDYLGSEDTHRVPVGNGRMAGITVQALAVNTILEGMPLRDVPPWAWMTALFVACGALVGAMLLLPTWEWMGLAVAAFAVVDWIWLEKAAALAAMLMAMGAALMLRGRLRRYPG